MKDFENAIDDKAFNFALGRKFVIPHVKQANISIYDCFCRSSLVVAAADGDEEDAVTTTSIAESSLYTLLSS